jgi:membrane protein involved in colicin uptake
LPTDLDLALALEAWQQLPEEVKFAITRLALEAQQKEELALSKARQRDQQWQAKLDALRAEMQTQSREALRRRDAEADAGQADLEARLRKEMQEKDEAAQAKAMQREQDLIAQLTAKAEARQAAAQSQWEAEAEKKARAAIEPFKTLLARAEKERDHARYTAAEGMRQVQQLEKKLGEASTFLNGLRNGKDTETTNFYHLEEKVTSNGH